MRTFHFVLRHPHVGVVYADDFLFLLRRHAFLPLIAILMALAQVLNVPLSWRKLPLGLSLEYLGWALSVDCIFKAKILECKKTRILASLNWWLQHPKRVGRKQLSGVVGLLIWAAQVRLPLRAFLAPLFTALHRPTGKLQLLHTGQLAELPGLLDRTSLRVCKSARGSDVQAGWMLREVGGRSVSRECLDAALKQPKLKMVGAGCASPPGMPLQIWTRLACPAFEFSSTSSARLRVVGQILKRSLTVLRMPGLVAVLGELAAGFTQRLVRAVGFIWDLTGRIFLRSGCRLSVCRLALDPLS